MLKSKVQLRKVFAAEREKERGRLKETETKAETEKDRDRKGDRWRNRDRRGRGGGVDLQPSMQKALQHTPVYHVAGRTGVRGWRL